MKKTTPPILTTEDLNTLDEFAFLFAIVYAPSVEDAEDIFQESRITFRRKWPQMTHYDNPKAYYLEIVKNNCFKLYNKSKKEKVRCEKFMEEQNGDIQQPEIKNSIPFVSDNEVQNFTAKFQIALQALLSENMAGVFIFSMKEAGLSHKQIAALGHELLPNHGVKAHYNRCSQELSKFKRQLEDLIRKYFFQLGIHI